ncbi:HD domain-containing protein [Clostridiaceae bacterium HSG29]|nr:HD domain-containing protein [Clostridiaceae bacterium HSG29]
MKKKTMIRIIISVISILSFFVFPNFANNTINVGYYDDYPLVFQDDDGNSAGFFVEIFNEIYKDSDYTINYKYGSWKETLDSLNSGEVDIVVDILKSEKRDIIYDFNDTPLLLNYGKLCVYKKYKVDSFLDLNNLKIGYLDSDYYAVEDNGIIEMTNIFKLDIEYIPFDTYEEVLKAVEKNKVNAGVINSLTVNQIYDYKNIVDTDLVFAASGVKYATLKGENNEKLLIIDEKLNVLINDKNSYYYDRYNYWLKNKKVNYFKKFYRENINVIILVILFSLLIFILLRVEIYRKTKELKEANKNIGNLASKFENLINFLSFNIKRVFVNGNDLFLAELLNETLELVPEAKCGVVFKIVNDKLKIVNFKNYKDQKLHEVLIDVQKKLNGNARNQFIKSDKRIFLTFSENEDSICGLIVDIGEDSKEIFSKYSIRILRVLKKLAASYFLGESIHELNENFQKELILSIVQMLEIHDDYTKGHSESVANLSSKLAKHMGLSDIKVNEIYWTGLVHDIGKILINKDIITKDGKLTFKEYETIKKHPEFGYMALRKSKATKDIAKYVLCHHERIDGLGYPGGLKGDEIPIESKIVSIADSFDAMISSRSYRAKIDIDQALIEIENNLGTQFDKEIGRQFIEMMNIN